MATEVTTKDNSAESTAAAAPKSNSAKKTSKATADAKTTETKTTASTKTSTKAKSTSKAATEAPKITEIKPTKKTSATEGKSKKTTKKAQTAETKEVSAEAATASTTSKKTAKNVYKKAVENKEVSKVVTTPIVPPAPKENKKQAAQPKEVPAQEVPKEPVKQAEAIPEIKVSEIELIEEPKKVRNKYAVMIVKEHDDGNITTHHIGTALCEFILGALFVVILICACVIIYDSVSLKKLRTEVVQQIAENTELTEQNEVLSVENDSLSAKVAVLSETVSKKAATEEAMTQEESENAMPKGFPLSGGTSTMTSGTDDNVPILKFDASSGINIVSSGTGTVLAIEEDADYGHRIIIDHGNGYRSIYRNAGEPLVKEGDSLGKGYILFSVGNNNASVGYQIMVDNEYIDPMDVIEING